MPSKSLIETKIAKQMLKKLSYKFPNLEEHLFKNGGMIDFLAKKEIEAIKEFREDMYIRCGNLIWKPLVINRDKDRAKMWFNIGTVNNICKGTMPSVFHSHGNYPADSSPEDRASHSEMFIDGFQDGIVLGVDGIEVQTKYMQTFKVPWSDAFYERLEDEGISNVIQHVKSIDCIRINEKKNNRECSIDLMDGMGKITNIYDEIIYKLYPEAPYKVLNDRFGIEKHKNITFDPNYKNMCIVTQNKDKRVLSCFQKLP